MEQSFAWWSFALRASDPKALAAGADEIGLSGVEMVPPELWSMVEDCGLRMVTMAGQRSPAATNPPSKY